MNAGPDDIDEDAPGESAEHFFPRGHTAEEFQAIGAVAANAGMLESIMMNVFSAMTESDFRTANAISGDMSFNQLRTVCTRLTALYLERDPASEKWASLRDWLASIGDVMTRRNHLVHSAWISSSDGMTPMIRRGDVSWYTEPTDMLEVAERLIALQAAAIDWIGEHASTG